MVSIQSLVEEALRDAGRPLSLDELVARVQARQALDTKKPAQSIRNALSGLHTCQSVARGRCVDVPHVLRESYFRLPVEVAEAEGRRYLLVRR